MTNHFHLLLWPHEDGDLSRWMQWLMTSAGEDGWGGEKGSGLFELKPYFPAA